MADDKNTAPGRGGAPQATQNPPNNPPSDQPEGFWHSVASSVGIDPEAVKATAKAFRDHPEEAAKAVADEFGSETEQAGKQIVQHPLDSAGQVVSGAASMVEDPNAHQRAIDEMKQPGVMPKVAGAEEYLEATIPFIGGGIEKSQEQANAGNYKGAAGTLTGTIVPTLVGGEGASAEGAAANAGAEEAVAGPKFADIGGKEVLPAETSPSGQETQAVENTPEPQYNQALARRGEIPNQKVTLTPAYGDTGKYVGGHNMLAQERQSALKEPYKVEVQTPEGITNTEEISAFSPKNAMAVAQKKFPDASSVRVDSFGEREPSNEYTVPTGKHLSLPATARPIEQVMPHELGHAMVAHKEGLETRGMLRHTHVDASRDMSAGVQFGGPGVFRYDGSVRPDKAEAVVRTLMGGIAADEVFNNIPRAENHNFDFKTQGSDGNMALRVLQKHGYDTSQAIQMIQNAVDDSKEYLQHPAVSGVIKENAGVREPDLSRQYHFSAERLRNMHEEAQRRIGDAESNNSTIGGETSPAAVEAGRPETSTQGAGQSLKAAHISTEPAPQSVTPQAPAKEPFKGTHYSPVAVEGDTLSGTTRGKAAAGSEKDRLQYENRVPGVYAYREGAQTESQISSRANKYNISGDKAIADIGPNGEQRAMFQKAHQDAFEQYKASGDIDTVASHKALNDAEAKLRDAGYDGYESKATRPGSVFLFGNQKIEQPAMTAKSLTLEAPPEEEEKVETPAAPDWNKAAKNFKKNGGFTVNASTGEAPTKGYQVEVGTEQGRTFDHAPSAAEIQQFATDNKDLFEKNPELHVGGYKNGDKYELNVSANAESLPEAKKVAKKLDQISIWDNANAQEIQTGGKSGRREYPNYPIEERLSELKGGMRSDVPEFQHLSKPIYDNMEPDEREYVKGSKILQNNVMKAYHELQPSVNETTNAMQAGAALGGWWNRYIDIFHNLVGDSDKSEVANTIGPSHAEVLKQWHAALSGNKSVADANNLAWHSYADWLDAGKPTDRKSIDDIIRKNGAQPEDSGKRGNAAISDTLGKRGKIMSKGLDTSKLYELVNSPEMKGEREFHNDVFSDDTKKNPLMGPTIGARKIPSMGATVAGKGNLNRLVIDTHIRDFYGQKAQGPAAQYIADSVHLRQAAKALGLKGGEGQEQLWGTVLGLKTLLREGLTPPEAAGKLDSDVINQIGKDYAEVIANDPEITKPGGILDRIKEKYGIGVGSEGFGEAHSKALSANASQGQPGGSEEAVDRSQLGKTAERIRGTIADSRIKKAPEEDDSFNFGANVPESAPKKNKKGPVNALDLINLLSNLNAPAISVK